MTETVVYMTTDDEKEANDIANSLWRDERRRAQVESVERMSRRDDPLTPDTTDRWAVLAEKADEPKGDK